MEKEVKNKILFMTDELLSYLDSMSCGEHVSFTPEEVAKILKQEEQGAKENYDRAIQKFMKSNRETVPPKVHRFVVYWGYPGAGKSVMTNKLIERFAKDEDCLPFNIIDKDEHRSLFPNLFEHLQGGHIDECEKFAGVTIDYVRRILDLSLENGCRSVLSVGSMGAGVEFKDNAQKAIAHGYKPCAVYMAVNPDVAYLSNVYRSATLYDKIIFQNQQLYPRLVSSEYFSRVVNMLPNMIDNISKFQQENADNVDLLVVNRKNQLLYDTRGIHEADVRSVIEREEHRPLNNMEIITINQQLHKIKENMKYRYENGVYTPCKSEVEVAKVAVGNIAKLIESQPTNEAINVYLLGKKASGFDF
ncbi:MAG: zeta toxin family protein [Alphaproteobacteria bacterium]|nr:zeta toxin family protein [Alphaproteobacteria bacterium]